MDRISKRAWWVAGLAFLAWSSATPDDAPAATLRHAKNFIFPSSETLHDDLYAAGTIVDIQGTVDGDLVVAGQTVTIGGFVTGDVIAMGRDVTISGSVGGTVRAAGNSITIDGTVGHDVLAGCGNLVIGPRASIGRDVLGGAGNESFGGRIARDVRAGGGSVTFSGNVGGNVYAHAKEIRLTDGAVLEKDFLYTSRSAMVKSAGATIRGKTEQRVPKEDEGRHGPFAGSPVIGWLQGLVGFLILGALFFLLTGAGHRTLETLGVSPWASLGIGALLASGVPCAALFLFFLGIFFGGWWIGIGVLVLHFFALALGYVITSLLAGRWILGRFGRGGPALTLPLAVGLVTMGLVTAIPFLGALTGFVAALFGLGALAITWYRARRGARIPAAATT
jgi:cytoskeletal protein CcmA (bactofilin family)